MKCTFCLRDWLSTFLYCGMKVVECKISGLWCLTAVLHNVQARHENLFFAKRGVRFIVRWKSSYQEKMWFFVAFFLERTSHNTVTRDPRYFYQEWRSDNPDSTELSIYGQGMTDRYDENIPDTWLTVGLTIPFFKFYTVRIYLGTYGKWSSWSHGWVSSTEKKWNNWGITSISYLFSSCIVSALPHYFREREGRSKFRRQ